jgi:hypothetical protein
LYLGKRETGRLRWLIAYPAHAQPSALAPSSGAPAEPGVLTGVRALLRALKAEERRSDSGGRGNPR